MKRTTVMKILAPILAVLLLNQVATALLRFDISKEVFVFVHKSGGVLLAVVALLHLAVNWNWVKTNFFRNKPKN